MRVLFLFGLVIIMSCNNERGLLKPVTLLVSNKYSTDGKIDSGSTSATTYFYSQAFQVRGFKSVVKGKCYFFGEEKKPLDSALIVWATFPYNYHQSEEYKNSHQ